MVGERTIPLLPCGSIDQVEDFYRCLGFTRTYRQVRPNPYVALERDDIALGFFGMPGFDPADSYGSCVVIVPDIAALHAAFATGLRERYGRIPASGIPRMTRPRPRKNADGLTGFALVDPGGNWIRISADRRPAGSVAPSGKLADALANAVVLGDSRGTPEQAAKILDGAIGKYAADSGVRELVAALAYLAELNVRTGETGRARSSIARIRAIELTDAERADVADELLAIDDIDRDLQKDVGADGFEPPTARV